jgi:hypothetical protein
MPYARGPATRLSTFGLRTCVVDRHAVVQLAQHDDRFDIVSHPARHEGNLNAADGPVAFRGPRATAGVRPCS